ncbi:MAG: type II secretion system F family protein [Candidatus Margulisbacteria bacterium]|jgi:type II secretory pathway component PulF|nr:type II secretion system F family protein [Candidatus Margulisiibacteriota bacterium]
MPDLRRNLELLAELDAFLNCGYQQGELLGLLRSELGRRYRPRLLRGEPLSAVWELEPELALILRAAELNGSLSDFVALALEHYQDKLVWQNTLRQKSAYPLLVLVFTVLLLFGFVFGLLPLFNSLAAELGGEPGNALWPWLFGGGLILFLLNIRPLCGFLLAQTGLNALDMTVKHLNLLLLTERAGIPLANFLAEYLKENPRSEFNRVYFYLGKGVPVGEALSKAGLCGAADLRLLGLGGGANYARGLAYLQKTLRQEYQAKINKILFWLEPGLLLFTGGVLAALAWGFFRPLFNYAALEF